jgi:hypothetical protein
MSKYIGIKRDSTFPITVGGNTLINLQKLLLYILADKTEEDIQLAQEKISKQQWDEDWYEHLAFLSIIIRSIEQAGHEKGLTVEEDLSQVPPSTQQEN